MTTNGHGERPIASPQARRRSRKGGNPRSYPSALRRQIRLGFRDVDRDALAITAWCSLACLAVPLFGIKSGAVLGIAGIVAIAFGGKDR